jgi:glucose/arabinose dehydrogenase
VDRFVWDGTKLTFDRNITKLPSRITDLTMDRRRGNHNGGVIKFGPDGKLYVVIGDQNTRGALANVAGGPSAAEMGVVASLLRLNDDGTIPADNPFASDPATAPVYAFGVRNSFGFDFDPEGGKLWLEVNGQASYDHVGWYPAGSNLGWIQLMGPPSRFSDYKDLEVNTTRLLDAPQFPPQNLASNAEEARARLTTIGNSVYRTPVFSWRRAVALTDVEFVHGNKIGSAYNGDLLLGDVNTGTIYHFDLTPDRNGLVLSGGLADGVNDNETSNLRGELGDDNILGTGFGLVTDIETAPDGDVWIASLGQGVIYEITAQS